MKKRVLIAFYNMGGPSSTDDVERFLGRLFNDSDLLDIPFGRVLQSTVASKIITKRLTEVKERYTHIGGKSPQLEITQELANKVQRSLAMAGHASFEFFGPVPMMRYSAPFAADVLATARHDGIDELWLFSQYPHCSRATTGTSLRELALLLRQESHTGQVGAGTGIPEQSPAQSPERSATLSVRSFATYFDDPAFLDLWAGRLRKAWDALASHRKFLLVSAHNLPRSYVAEGDPYAQQIYRTAREVCRRAGLHEGVHWQLCWQSAVGPVKWLEPDTRDGIRTAHKRGVQSILVWPVSFVSDHIETLHEIDVEFGDIARDLGVQEFKRVQNLNSDPDFVDYMAHTITHAADDLARYGSTPRLRNLTSNPSGEGCHTQPGGCLCARYFMAGAEGLERGVKSVRIPRFEPDACDLQNAFHGNATPLCSNTSNTTNPKP